MDKIEAKKLIKKEFIKHNKDNEKLFEAMPKFLQMFDDTHRLMEIKYQQGAKETLEYVLRLFANCEDTAEIHSLISDTLNRMNNNAKS